MRFKCLKFVPAVAVACAAHVSTAQAQDSSALATEYVGITTGGSLQAEDHIGGASIERFTPSAQLSSKDDQISAEFALDYRFASQPRLTGGKLTGSFLAVSLKGSLPLNGTDKDASVDFKSFGNGGKLTLGFNFFRPSVVSVEADYPVIRLAGKTCVSQAADDWVADGHDTAAELKQAQAAKDRYKLAEQDESFGVFELIDEVLKPGVNEGSVEAQIKANCTRSGNPAIGNDSHLAALYARDALSPTEYARWRKAHRQAERTWFAGGEISLGYNRFSIVDRPSLTLVRTDRIGFDANARFGAIFARANTMVLASGGYTRSYKAKDLVDVCGPPDPLGNSTCINGQDGAPERTETGYASLAVRQVMLRNRHGEPILGIRPSATYIFEDKDWQFELPIYFQRSSKGGLDAGVRAIYNTGVGKVAFGAFVGAPF